MPDAEYEALLRKKMLHVDAALALVEEQITALKEIEDKERKTEENIDKDNTKWQAELHRRKCNGKYIWQWSQCLRVCTLDGSEKIQDISHKQEWEQIPDKQNFFATCKGFASC